MKGYLTSFAGLFGEQPSDAPQINRIEIPLIQRDYAQGRRTQLPRRSGRTSSRSCTDAITGGEPVGLDFIYGEVENGTFHPLDGQQRLTTLFLIHWYLALRWRASCDPDARVDPLLLRDTTERAPVL